ncbi:MAG: UDP-3-O-(3-hydroxymyristoyl)glucosamine N-acyltransferase [candidate division WOR-3 bacterium]
MKIKEIADFLKKEVRGDSNFEIKGISEISDVREGHLVFIFDGRKVFSIKGLDKAASIVPDTVKECPAKAWIKVEDVKGAMIGILKEFYWKKPKVCEGQIENLENLKHVKMGKNVKVGKNVFIGENCVFGNDVNIFPFSYIGNDVEIGDRSVIYPHSIILDNTKIGKEVIIYPGVVIGSSGFGYHQVGEKFEAIPHIGRVVIEDRVEIGALSMIDRGTIGDTIIGEGTKIDNGVHIAHNVKIGKNVIILAQVGISGSCEIEDGAVIAGQVGIADHIKIGKGAKVVAKSGVDRDVEDGEVVFGYPAIRKMEMMRLISYFKRLPELFNRVKKLEDLNK